MFKKSFWIKCSVCVLFLILFELCLGLGLSDLFNNTENIVVVDEAPLKMYAKCEATDVSADKKSLSFSACTYQDAYSLYDKNSDTVFECDREAEIVLDLGKTRMLGGVKLTLPKYDNVSEKSRCIGTKFYVSADNKSFRKTAELSSAEFASDAEEVKEVAFGGGGEYRYVKAVIPRGAKISELEWLEYPEWNYTKALNGTYEMKLSLYAFDVRRSCDARIAVSICNPREELKYIKVYKCNFKPDAENETEIVIPNIKREAGDTCRVTVWDGNGDLIIENPLVYHDNGASYEFAVAKVFSDDMVLQAEKPLKIWGKAPVGDKVDVKIENKRGGIVSQSSVSDLDSNWEADLGSFTAGGDYKITICCNGKKIDLDNITFGDVWLCVGQSNMEYYMNCGKDTVKYLKSKKGKAESENSDIRVLNLLNKDIEGAGAELENIPTANWETSDNASSGYCSAIGYWFARKINQKYDIPVGLICAAVGDTEIARWLPHGAYGSFVSEDGGLYYNRIAPLSDLQIRGILMYQGEADEYRTHLTAEKYSDAMAGLVDLYRKNWGEDLPFYWAQLTRYNKDESEVRNGQYLALAKVKNKSNTGLVSLIDIYGEYKADTGNCRTDIHPHQKELAAERFFRYADRDVYGDTATAHGPVLKKAKIDGDSIELTYECTGNLEVMPPEAYSDSETKKYIEENGIDTTRPHEFEIAGIDGCFKTASAYTDGNKLILHSDEVKEPIYVRYAWGAYPELPNLTDESGLPSYTFSVRAE